MGVVIAVIVFGVGAAVFWILFIAFMAFVRTILGIDEKL